MRNEDVDYIPGSLICKRWTKIAKSDYISYYKTDEMESDVMDQACYATVAAACDNFTKKHDKGSKNVEVPTSDTGDNTAGSESEKEAGAAVETNVCDMNPQCASITKKWKEKLNCGAKKKRKKVKQELKSNNDKDLEMNGGGSSGFAKAEFCQGLANYPPFHIPSNVSGNFSQGSILPNLGIAHIQGQIPFPVYSHNS
ncbi:Protein FAR1-RELATED SEQUENCE 9 [Sesbania bispinosa]|nr:Protein FAR1-RELATED SEQUENCE 9 [Sesbania bispinosa]